MPAVAHHILRAAAGRLSPVIVPTLGGRSVTGMLTGVHCGVVSVVRCRVRVLVPRRGVMTGGDRASLVLGVFLVAVVRVMPGAGIVLGVVVVVGVLVGFVGGVADVVRDGLPGAVVAAVDDPLPQLCL